MAHDPFASTTAVLPLPAPAPLASVQGTLALDLQPRHDPPPVPAYDGRRSADVIDIETRSRRDLERWALRYVQAAIEIVGGDRPVSQLLRWTSREVFENLDRRAQLVARAGRHQPGQGRVQPVRPRVQGVRTCFLSREVVEVSVHVRYGERSRAVAARFERRADPQIPGRADRSPADPHWCCTALDFS